MFCFLFVCFYHIKYHDFTFIHVSCCVTADGLDAPTDNCTAGWYCTGGSYMAEPVTTDNATDLSECTCPLANYTGN